MNEKKKSVNNITISLPLTVVIYYILKIFILIEREMIMGSVLTWINAIALTAGAVIALIPCVIGIIRALKSKRQAKTEEEISKADLDLRNQVDNLIVCAEKAYLGLEDAFKKNGLSCGVAKKDIVLTKLQSYALEKGYSFDVEFWSNKIDEIVAITKKVNS